MRRYPEDRSAVTMSRSHSHPRPSTLAHRSLSLPPAHQSVHYRKPHSGAGWTHFFLSAEWGTRRHTPFDVRPPPHRIPLPRLWKGSIFSLSARHRFQAQLVCHHGLLITSPLVSRFPISCLGLLWTSRGALHLGGGASDLISPSASLLSAMSANEKDKGSF